MSDCDETEPVPSSDRTCFRMCQIRSVDEHTARLAARMRTTTGRADDISATDAIVAAFAGSRRDSVILTSDPIDLTDLVDTQSVPVGIAAGSRHAPSVRVALAASIR
jgi:hypothetical protein